jgi:hypothetical protein
MEFLSPCGYFSRTGNHFEFIFIPEFLSRGAHLSVSFPHRGPHVGTPSPAGAPVVRPPPRVLSLLSRALVYSSGRQLLSEERRPKCSLKPFIVVASRGPPENVTLWPLLRLTTKPTLSSPSTVSCRPRSACSGCRSPHPSPSRAQDHRALVREEPAPRAARRRPRRRSLSATSASTWTTFAGHLLEMPLRPWASLGHRVPRRQPNFNFHHSTAHLTGVCFRSTCATAGSRPR